MNKTAMVTTAALIVLAAASCNDQKKQSTSLTTDYPPADTAISKFIPRDSANRMISSYLVSIGYPSDSMLVSLSIDAGMLRDYLADTAIKRVKLSLAHSLSYINAGGLNQSCGYNNNALTLIVSGYNLVGQIRYFEGNSVMDYSAPCPSNCPPGQAANPLFPTLSSQ